MKSTFLPPGLADELPPFASNNLEAKGILLETFTAAGYELVMPPPLEYLENLSTDDAQMLRFPDPVSHRMLALRNDFTPQLARIAATSLKSHPRPLRLCYCGEVIATKSTVLHPNRCWSQAGLEIFGFSNQTQAVKEVILLGLEALHKCGLKNLSLDLNYPSLWNTQNAPELEEAVTRKNSGALRRINTPEANALAAILELPTASNKVAKAAAKLPEPTRKIIDSLVSLADQITQDLPPALPKLQITIDPLEQRGFGYYEGITFSYFCGGIRSEIGRGGHYIASAKPSKIPLSRQGKENGAVGSLDQKYSDENSGKQTKQASPKGGIGEEAVGLSLFTDILPKASKTKAKILAAAGVERSLINKLRANGEIVLENGDPKSLASQAKKLKCHKILSAEGKLKPIG